MVHDPKVGPVHLKNPYHLFTSYERKRLRRLQKESASAINEAIKEAFKGTLPRGLRATATTIGDFQKPAYVDLTDERVWEHLKAMNSVLSAELQGVEVDLADPKKRTSLIETFEYQFPDAKDLQANRQYNELRGVWQLLQPSLKYDNISKGGQSVRMAVLLIYGFITARQENEKKHIDLLMIGPTTTWQAEAWISVAEKLYVHAFDSMRYNHALNEDQFFVFDASKPSDRYHGTYLPTTLDYSSVDAIKGVLSGTSLDEKFEGRFPAVAAPCVARKLKGWSEWFALNDHIVDADLVSTLRNQLSLAYYDASVLRSKSHNVPIDASALKRHQEQKRSRELYYKLDELLQMICTPEGDLIKPIVR